MTRGTWCVVAMAWAMGAGACGDDSSSKPCESEVCDDGDGQQGSTSLLGSGAGNYTEADEAGNSATPEKTGYVLEVAQGLAIEGSFEKATATGDSFVFNSGELGTAGQPGFPGVDIQVVVDGEALDSGGVFLGLDSVKDFGYSSLSGNYFMNAALIRGQDYVLTVTPSASLAGQQYTVEIRGHVADK